MLHYTLNPEQFRSLEGLSYWIANKSYVQERYGNSDDSLTEIRRTLDSVFNELDALRVPFWVQNSVIAWADQWRNTRREYLADVLTAKGIEVSHV